MSSSRNIVSGAGAFGTFVEKLRSVHEVQMSSPALRGHRAEMEKRFDDASEQGYLTGYAAGFSQGEAKGLEAGLETGQSKVMEAHSKEIESFATAMRALGLNAEESVEDWRNQAEDQLAVLAVEIARRAVMDVIEVNKDSVVAIAKKVLAEVMDGTRVRIRVNPSEAAILESHRAEIMQELAHVRNVEVVSDSTVGAGCIVDSEDGVIDGRIESYLERIASHVRSAA